MIRRSIPLSALVALALLAGAARADDALSLRTVSTTGTASVFAAPDRVDVSFSVQTFDADLAKAKSAGDAAAASVLQFLKAQGVPEAMIRSDFATSEAIYDEQDQNGRIIRGPLKGYQVTRSYGVRLDDVAKFGVVLDQLLVDPLVRVGGHAFSVKNDRTLRDDARRQATRAAREKAELLAGELGCAVGVPRQIDEVGGGAQPMNRISNFYAGGGERGAASEVAPVGQVEIRAEVNVRFDVAPKG